ncbi:hypothetical protein NPIL_391151 [Nephila pilipes]|uniref:Uncharacterized protein n=1 Tax=Nephila pilipes TaxID=299642 RepID=A0A8X6NXC2_NEPPI|nr:hypothetical protein NPIL_391151 [Nephila pilipes]
MHIQAHRQRKLIGIMHKTVPLIAHQKVYPKPYSIVTTIHRSPGCHFDYFQNIRPRAALLVCGENCNFALRYNRKWGGKASLVTEFSVA